VAQLAGQHEPDEAEAAHAEQQQAGESRVEDLLDRPRALDAEVARGIQRGERAERDEREGPQAGSA
jgi:hypothetical protein